MAPSSPKMVKDSHMVWVDCEMTGLDTSKDHLLEIAVIITDKDLNILAEGPDLVIHQTDEVRNIYHTSVLRFFVHFLSMNLQHFTFMRKLVKLQCILICELFREVATFISKISLFNKFFPSFQIYWL